MQSPLRAKPVIGIVGGIGAGKSTVAAELAALGCAVIDADNVGHELLNDSQVRQELCRRWGQAVLTAQGQVDRAAVGRIVFGKSEELDALNTIMHPRMKPILKAEIDRLRKLPTTRAIVLDAAVLFEAGWDDLCSHKIFVDATQHQRVDRVRDSRGWDAKGLADRENSQISLDNKRAKCDYTIVNSSSVSYLREQIRRVLNQIVEAAHRG